MGKTDHRPVILQATLPDAQRQIAARALPGMQPVGQGDWITVDDAYSAQLHEKARLLATLRPRILQVCEGAAPAAQEALATVLGLLADRPDFAVGKAVTRPDGMQVPIDRTDPLGTLGRLIQEDICILQKRGREHLLTAALLCFPAGWTLAEKIGRPLLRIHKPVPDYDNAVAARVQRLFDGVQVGRPIWRANALHYGDPALFAPHTEDAPRPAHTKPKGYLRSERQTLIRLPQTQAVIFAIHTTVVADPALTSPAQAEPGPPTGA